MVTIDLAISNLYRVVSFRKLMRKLILPPPTVLINILHFIKAISGRTLIARETS